MTRGQGPLFHERACTSRSLQKKIDRRSSRSVGVRRNCPTSRAGVQEMLMAGKTIQAPPQKEVAETTTDTLPLLDLSDAAVKTLISTAKKRGYVTHEQVKLLAEEGNFQEVQDVLGNVSAIGVHVVETDEPTDDEEQG